MDKETSGTEGSDNLTTRQGHPVTDNQNMRTIGNRGPATMENYQFMEKLSHFDRERVPEGYNIVVYVFMCMRL